MLAHRAVLEPAEDADQGEQEEAEEHHGESTPPMMGTKATVRISETNAARELSVRIRHLIPSICAQAQAST